MTGQVALLLRSVQPWSLLPNATGVGLLLIAAGLLLLEAECLLPGRVLPGSTGLLLALLGVYRLSSLPLSHTALFLAAAGAVVLALSMVPGLRWTAGITGTALLASGAFLLDTATAGPNRSLLGGALGLALGCSTFFLLQVAARARRGKRSRPAPHSVSNAWQPYVPE